MISGELFVSAFAPRGLVLNKAVSHEPRGFEAGSILGLFEVVFHVQ